MQTFVALLRGINVGKANRIPMAELRALLVDQGYSNVATLLNSGNAVFRAANGTPSQHAEEISSAILGKFNLQVPVIFKSAKELATIIQGNPLETSGADHSQLLVAFVQKSSALLGLSPIEQLVAVPEQFIAGKDAAYLLCANGILESKAAKALLGKTGKETTTTRNWATVLKLQALANENN
jgi:uncharacterized protein (DUF1697 family)